MIYYLISVLMLAKIKDILIIGNDNVALILETMYFMTIGFLKP